jgi:hypothetical protein
MSSAPLESLAKRIWITKGARLNAARRLESRHTWSTRAVACLSAYLIGISLLLLTDSLRANPNIQLGLSIASIFVSVLVLVFSLVEGQADYRVKAERLHGCAKELLAIELRAERARQAERLADEDVASIEREFVRIVDRCPENHLPVDYELFKASRPEFPLGHLHRYAYPLYYWTSLLWLYWAAVALPPLVVAWIALRT